MSWYNPTPEEAIEAYMYHQSRYYNAANDRNSSIRQEEAYVSQKNVAINQKNELSTQKVNFEKRLDGIIKIIKMLEGTGGWFATNVPNTISKAKSAIQKTDSSYRRSIKMTGGVSAASLETAFAVKTVEEDYHSASALKTYKSEKIRLEQSIADIKNQISSLSEQISSLNSQIRACNTHQDSLKHIMNSSAYEMNHYRRYMY